MASHAEAYNNVPGIHPSEPNYLWLEAGTNFGVADDNDPSSNSQSSKAHLVDQLETAGLTWKSYQEDIDGTSCPLTAVNNYAPKHNPMVFFDDVTNNQDPNAQRCIQHVRPYTELATDLANNTVPAYSFITPNLCDDMHGVFFGCSSNPSGGDKWLSTAIPKIMASSAYKNGGAIFITWDESEGGDFPIGMIALSPFAKGHGYSNTIPYSHSSTLRSFQEIFGVGPFLGDAANATDLSDFFTQFP
jgi:phospholipase C